MKTILSAALAVGIATAALTGASHTAQAHSNFSLSLFLPAGPAPVVYAPPPPPRVVYYQPAPETVAYYYPQGPYYYPGWDRYHHDWNHEHYGWR